MSAFSPRDLDYEASKHFKGTPEERIKLALRLGREALKLFMAGAGRGMTEAEARAHLRRVKHAGRRPSRVMSGDE